MRMYRCTGTLQFHAQVEASSLAEATRIIDGILEGATEVTIRENDTDELNAAMGSATRGRIQVEN